jgi:hypothetical protein
LLLTVALEAVGSRCMALGTWLRHGCTIRRRRPVLSVSIPLWLPWGLHGVSAQQERWGWKRVLLQTP